MTVRDLGIEAIHRLELCGGGRRIELAELREPREVARLDEVRILLQKGSEPSYGVVEPRSPKVDVGERQCERRSLATASFARARACGTRPVAP